MITNISGTAFTAVSTTAINQTKKELSQEEIIPSSDNSKTDKISNISYETSHKIDDSHLVAFKDPHNDKYVLVSLKNDTIDTLKSHFSKDDFYDRDDGILRLNNKAEAYVSGWFGDIAYKREFLKADSNNDGVLNEGEYKNTKNSFKHSGEVVATGGMIKKISTWISGIYESSKSKSKNTMKQINPTSMEQQLDITINKDKNFNSTVSFNEALTSHYNQGTKDSIISLANEMLGSDISRNRAEVLEINLTWMLLQESIKQQQEKLESLERLKQNNGDTSKLTKDEKELLGEEIKKSTNEEGEIDPTKLNEIIKNIQTTKIYKEEDKSQKIGKYYEDRG